MSSSSLIKNRPLILGPGNEQMVLMGEYEVSIRILNANNNPSIIGKAKVGTPETEPGWQLMKLEYDSNGLLEKILWAVNPETQIPTSNYLFRWSEVSTINFE